MRVMEVAIITFEISFHPSFLLTVPGQSISLTNDKYCIEILIIISKIILIVNIEFVSTKMNDSDLACLHICIITYTCICTHHKTSIVYYTLLNRNHRFSVHVHVLVHVSIQLAWSSVQSILTDLQLCQYLRKVSLRPVAYKVIILKLCESLP